MTMNPPKNRPAGENNTGNQMKKKSHNALQPLRKPKTHEEGVKDIIHKVRLMRGNDPIDSDLKLLNKKV